MADTRFSLVYVDNGVYFVADSKDGTVDTLNREQILHCIALGFSVGGINPVQGARDFHYTEDFFLRDAISETDDDNVEYEDSDNEFDDYNEDDYGDFAEEDDEPVETDDQDDYTDYDDSNNEDYDDNSESSDEVEEGYDDSDEDYDDFDDYSDEDVNDDETDVGSEIFADEYDEEEDDSAEFDYSANVEVETDNFYEELRTYLSTDQLRLLSMYYLKRSQLIFNEMERNSKRILTAKKTAEFKALRVPGKEWIYGGCIDLGYMHGGTCSMGHALRYMHIALDITKVDPDKLWVYAHDNMRGETDEEVSRSYVYGGFYDLSTLYALEKQGYVCKFGVVCASDFFNVDEDSLTRLKKMQQESTNEMKELLAIYKSDDATNEYKESFKFLDELMDRLILHDARCALVGNKSDLLASRDMLSLYKSMREQGMVYPRTLVKYLRKCITGLREDKYIGKPNFDWGIVLPSLKMMGLSCKRDLSEVVHYSSSFLSMYLRNALLCRICGLYQYDATSSNPRNRDDGGRSKFVCGYYSLLGRMEAGDIRIDRGKVEFNIPYIRKLFAVYELASTTGIVSQDLKVPLVETAKNGIRTIKPDDYETSLYKLGQMASLYMDSAETSVPEDDRKLFYNLFRSPVLRLIRNKINSDRNGTGVSLDDFYNPLQEYASKRDYLIADFNSWVYNYILSDVTKNNEIRTKELSELKAREKKRAEELDQLKRERDAKFSNDFSNTLSKLKENGTSYVDTMSGSALFAFLKKTYESDDALREKVKETDHGLSNAIISTVSGYTNQTVSPKQAYHLRRAVKKIVELKSKEWGTSVGTDTSTDIPAPVKNEFNKITGAVTVDGKTFIALNSNPELKSAIEELVSRKDEVQTAIGGDLGVKTIGILTSVMKWGKCSEKQYKYVKSAKSALGLN